MNIVDRQSFESACQAPASSYCVTVSRSPVMGAAKARRRSKPAAAGWEVAARRHRLPAMGGYSASCTARLGPQRRTRELEVTGTPSVAKHLPELWQACIAAGKRVANRSAQRSAREASAAAAQAPALSGARGQGPRDPLPSLQACGNTGGGAADSAAALVRRVLRLRPQRTVWHDSCQQGAALQPRALQMLAAGPDLADLVDLPSTCKPGCFLPAQPRVASTRG